MSFFIYTRPRAPRAVIACRNPGFIARLQQCIEGFGRPRIRQPQRPSCGLLVESFGSRH